MHKNLGKFCIFCSEFTIEENWNRRKYNSLERGVGVMFYIDLNLESSIMFSFEILTLSVHIIKMF